MRLVVKGDDLKKIMTESINLICDAVSSSLGPSGNNVLIDTDEMVPFITNEGVTIARYIESDDPKINAILEIIKEASLKTDEDVGDGTTTTLVLLKAIYEYGINEIEKGKDGIILKKELMNELDNVIMEIKKISRKPTKKDLIKIGTISANDQNISLIINEVFSKMKNKDSIKIDISKNESTYYEIKKGYSIDTNISPLYFKDNNDINLSNSYVLLIRGYLDDLEKISLIINDFLNNNKNLIIIATEISEQIKQEILIYKLKENKNIYAFELADYASRTDVILDDLEYITNSHIKDLNYENVYFDDLGLIDLCTLKKEELVFISNKNVDERLVSLKKELSKTYDDYDREFISNRISKLENGEAIIYVGGTTLVEKKERKMRFIDALSSISMASYGVIVGEGITLYKISEFVNNDVLKESLKVPLKKIFENVGVDYKLIVNEINNDKIYNFKTNMLENVKDTDIIDATKVVVEALKNATSIASMLLTTNYLVINENNKIIKEI